MTITAETPVWDTPSGMGGTFTVALLETILPVRPSSRGSVMAASMRQAATIPGANGMATRSVSPAPNSLIRAGLPIRPRATDRRGEGGCRVAQNSTAGPYFAFAAFKASPHIRSAFQASSPKTFQGAGASWPHFFAHVDLERKPTALAFGGRGP